MAEETVGLEKFDAILSDVRRACEKGGTPWIPEVIVRHTSIFVPDLYKRVKLAYCKVYPDEYRLYMILGVTIVWLKVEDEEEYKGVTLYIEHPMMDIEQIVFSCLKTADGWRC